MGRIEQLLDNLTRTEAIAFLVAHGYDKSKVTKLNNDRLMTAYDIVDRKFYNQSLLRRLKKLPDNEFITLAHGYKIESRVNDTNSFQRDYNTVLRAAQDRGLMR